MAGGEGTNDKKEPKEETKVETKPETKVEAKVDGKDKKEKKDEQKEFKFAAKADSKSGMEGFMLFMWNPETKEFLGRTGMSWLKIGVFYLVYYACLAGFFMLMLLAFFQTLHDDKPAWDSSNGIIGDNPGVGFRPMPPNKQIESTLIWFRHGDSNGNWQDWVKRLEDHMTDYKNETYAADLGAHSVECGDKGQIAPGEGGVCKIDQDALFDGRCKNETDYGFKEGKPCIMIKLNKIFNWNPDPYESLEEMPEDIPQTIRDAFQLNIEEGTPELNQRVWLECEGENPADKEHLGEVNYYPDRGVGVNFFPYTNQKGYLSPVVFAQLENPTHGVMIAIECKAWAKNIDHDSMERKGLTHFELMID